MLQATDAAAAIVGVTSDCPKLTALAFDRVVSIGSLGQPAAKIPESLRFPIPREYGSVTSEVRIPRDGGVKARLVQDPANRELFMGRGDDPALFPFLDDAITRYVADRITRELDTPGTVQ